MTAVMERAVEFVAGTKKNIGAHKKGGESTASQKQRSPTDIGLKLVRERERVFVLVVSITSQLTIIEL
jgi:hypothetical protein